MDLLVAGSVVVVVVAVAGGHVVVGMSGIPTVCCSHQSI